MKTIKIYPEFLLVAFPSQVIYELVSQWKQMVKSEIGEFASWDSKAHVTIAFFWNHKELDLYVPRIRAFCKLVIPTEVTFNKFVYGKETFLIEPDNFSKKIINGVIRGLHRHIDKKGSKPSAHISIGRELNEDYIPIASELLKDIEVRLEFPFKNLHLLRFSSETGHYSDTVEIFEFTGKEQPNLFS